MQRELKLPSTPKRIISLVPSITELLHDLGLVGEVVGLTKFCIHPKPWVQTKTRVGGTKKVNFEKIKALEPDLIIGNKEENTKEDIEALEKDYNVLMTDVNTFGEALEMITLIGEACNREQESLLLINQLTNLQKATTNSAKIPAIYLIWKDPYFAVGSQTFIDSMMELAGFENIIIESRYPEITLEKIDKASPKLLLLSTEPYPFDKKHLKEIKLKLKTTIPALVDGEMFSWYGSRLIQSFEYFKQLKLELGEK